MVSPSDPDAGRTEPVPPPPLPKPKGKAPPERPKAQPRESGPPPKNAPKDRRTTDAGKLRQTRRGRGKGRSKR